MRVSFVLGTRPEMIKLSPLLHEFQDHGKHEFQLIHTGQHYSESLDDAFFQELNLPEPDHHLGVGSATHAEQTAHIMERCEPIIIDDCPDIVFIQGDTNTVIAAALTVAKINDVDVGHVEAGLRSFDRDMPEEINRKIADHCSDLLFSPTEDAAANLQRENIDTDRIHTVGNTVVDAVYRHIELARNRTTVLDDLDVEPGEFALLTMHRAENVDNENVFEHIVSELESITTEGYTLLYPIHPRAEKRAREFDLYDRLDAAVTLVEPQDYMRFLRLEDEASVILTDSGGVQEEAIILGTPCITVRDSTERPETVEAGGNVLVDPLSGNIAETYWNTLNPEVHGRMTKATNPFGDGNASKRIVDICEQRYG